MKFTPQTVRQSLSPGHRKDTVPRARLEHFKHCLKALLGSINPSQDEEYHKTHVREFLMDAFYKGTHPIHNYGKTDLAIHKAGSAEGNAPIVLFELKRPGKSADFPDRDNLNCKALHELVLYYLRERIDNGNHHIRRLVITNAEEWFVFDALDWDRLFFRNTALVRDYKDWKAGKRSSGSTEHFYKHIASPAVINLEGELPYAHLRVGDYKKALLNADLTDDTSLVSLFKLFSPEHLLKERESRDANQLDRNFYAELLHILGLHEHEVKGRKLISRLPEGKRQAGSLLEAIIEQLEARDKLGDIPKHLIPNGSSEERLFASALELCITWLNRVLFLKLLEAQLLRYHNGNEQYRFLHSGLIRDFDRMDRLFFQILARPRAQRREKDHAEFPHVPYLNSSLFEATPLEHVAITIASLDNEASLNPFGSTVLTEDGKRRKAALPLLEYLLRFLNAYTYSVDGEGEIEEENRPLISASVLGLIFEKINGYRDGAVYTPSYITMHMSRETLRAAVVQKFNGRFGWECEDFEKGLYNKVSRISEAEANDTVDSLRICDPAVGSGHFLVSCLNELVSIKSDLGILTDAEGKVLRGYKAVIEEDELVVLDGTGEIFRYLPPSAGAKAVTDSQRVQETLFREKQRIIENCLFGVDLNPNSVKICRLRLWIELLKSAFYTQGSGYADLETLPNIDINIKQGNSLLSRYALTDSLVEAFKKTSHTLKDYKEAVATYKHSSDRQEKRRIEQMLEQVKGQFRQELGKRFNEKISKARGEAEYLREEARNLENLGMKPGKKQLKELEQAEKALDAAEAEKREIEGGALYRDAFEWRFEFPEVMDAEGNYTGFDVVIANPPYIRHEEIKEFKPAFEKAYTSFQGTADIYVYFVELGMRLLRPDGHFCYIFQNKWMRAGYGKPMRDWLTRQRIVRLTDFGDLPVFPEVTVYPCILSLQKSAPTESFAAATLATLEPERIAESILEQSAPMPVESLSPEGWTLSDPAKRRLLEKIKAAGTPLGEYVKGRIYRGVLTGCNEAFVIDAATRARLIEEDPRSAEVIKPFLAGKDVKRYQVPKAERFLILLKCGWTNENKGKNVPEEFLAATYPAVHAHLKRVGDGMVSGEIKSKGKGLYDRDDQGDYWWELRPCDYYDAFEKPKIVIPAITKRAGMILENKGFYSNDKTTIVAIQQNWIIGVLNSSLADHFLHSIASTRAGGFYEYKPMYLLQIPIIEPTNQVEFETAIQRRMEAEVAGDKELAAKLEAEIDGLVYGLYGISEEEIGLVEG